MNCRDAQKMAALHAGGDLPDRDIPNLMKHLDTCKECAKEFESLKQVRTIVKEIAELDAPEPLPADFSQIITDRIPERQKKRFPQIFTLFRLIRLRPAAVLAAAACLMIVYLGISHILLQRKVRHFTRKLEEVQTMVQRDRAEIEISEDFLSARSIEGPFQLSEWEGNDIPAIFAVLHKPDQLNKPNTYIIDYLGETDGVQNSTVRWIEENHERILSRAGSENNVYIAVYHMPGSSKSFRTMIAGFFIHRHKPYFNNGV
jgi:hypothetical protein